MAVALIAIAGSGIFWLFIDSIVDSCLDTGYLCQKVGDNWVTVDSINNSTFNGSVIPFHCKNYGLLTATIEITVAFSGGSFSSGTRLPYQETSNTAVKFDFALSSGQEKTVNVYFKMADNNNFTDSLSLETNQGLLRIMDAQKFGSQPWQQSYRELHYWLETNRFAPALTS